MRVKWSQNFLADANIASRCVAALNSTESDEVLEIGPGRGVLTQELSQKSGKLIAVEIDPKLAASVKTKFSSNPKVRVENCDFLDADLDALGFSGDKVKVIGNLPYAVVSPIIQKVLAWKKWASAVFMVQKEVGDRMLAAPGSRTYGILSIAVQAQCAPQKLFHVPRGCFRPAPQVESLVIGLTPLAEPRFDRAREAEFFKVVRGAFAHRRKTLLNSLEYALELPSAKLSAAIRDAGLSPGVRAETLGIDDFSRLTKVLYNGRSD